MLMVYIFLLLSSFIFSLSLSIVLMSFVCIWMREKKGEVIVMVHAYHLTEKGVEHVLMTP
jgi:hypothetical protein